MHASVSLCACVCIYACVCMNLYIIIFLCSARTRSSCYRLVRPLSRSSILVKEEGEGGGGGGGAGLQVYIACAAHIQGGRVLGHPPE